MAIYVKLGEKAESFYDPTTGTLVSKHEVVILTDKAKFSNKIKKAIAGGHLVSATKQDYEDYIEDNGLNTQNEAVEDWRENQDLDEAVLLKLKKEQLIELAIYYKTEYDAKDLASLSKAELVEEITEITSEEEE